MRSRCIPEPTLPPSHVDLPRKHLAKPPGRATRHSDPDTVTQTQCIFYAVEGGRDWNKYAQSSHHHNARSVMQYVIQWYRFLPAATARWSINAVSPPTSPHKTIEHGSIETNELYRTLMSRMTHHVSV